MDGLLLKVLAESLSLRSSPPHQVIFILYFFGFVKLRNVVDPDLSADSQCPHTSDLTSNRCTWWKLVPWCQADSMIPGIQSSWWPKLMYSCNLVSRCSIWPSAWWIIEWQKYLPSPERLHICLPSNITPHTNHYVYKCDNLTACWCRDSPNGRSYVCVYGWKVIIEMSLLYIQTIQWSTGKLIVNVSIRWVIGVCLWFTSVSRLFQSFLHQQLYRYLFMSGSS